MFILKSDFNMWWLDEWGSILFSHPHPPSKKNTRCTHSKLKTCFLLACFWMLTGCLFFFLSFFFILLECSFTWLFFLQKAKECYSKVLSGWFLFCGGREWVRQPDGRSLWFSRWLFCVVLSDTGQAHWHAASLPSISSPPLPSPPPPT